MRSYIRSPTIQRTKKIPHHLWWWCPSDGWPPRIHNHKFVDKQTDKRPSSALNRQTEKHSLYPLIIQFKMCKPTGTNQPTTQLSAVGFLGAGMMATAIMVRPSFVIVDCFGGRKRCPTVCGEEYTLLMTRILFLL